MVEKLELEGGGDFVGRQMQNSQGPHQQGRQPKHEQGAMGREDNGHHDRGDYSLAFMDGSKLENGKAGAGWAVWNQFSGGRSLGGRATVWDAEITAIAKTLRLSKGKRPLMLSDSWAAISAVVKAGRKGHRRTKELRQTVNPIAKRCWNNETAVFLGWVKCHIEIGGNKQQMKRGRRRWRGRIS